ncbi:MAG: Na(+)-translocating NADH-quinone reductase subunit A [Alistipes sp.]|nr:Na(+)-translocating NADH-quinone reductase subunit A [Alistipes sp.]
MSKIIKLKKGLDINLQGKAAESLVELPLANEYAVSPLDFENVTPKLLVKVGDKVKAGEPLFFDKNNPRVLFTSPVSGTVSAVNRGEKRKVLNVTVAADAQQESAEFALLDLQKATREEVIETLLKSGLWTMILQRPYGIVANPADEPKAIFVSAFDSAPLAADMNFALKGEKENLQKGLEVLSKLSGGKVHLSVKANAEGEMTSLKGAEIHTFEGKHPVGCVGVQIHHIDPIAKGDIVWTVAIQDVAAIGRLFSTGKVDLHKVVALAGSEVEKPQYYRIINGAPIASIVDGNIKKQAEGDSVRIIAGNVLTGKKVAADGFISATATQITVIPEGDKYEMLGWIAPRFNKFSVSRSYFSWLCPKKAYKLDTNVNGGVRAFVVTGLFEEYLPMDIYPMYLFKAIMANDIDKMENLGIYEIVEEDIALCEFVDPSKTEIQQLVRDGINLMIKEC